MGKCIITTLVQSYHHLQKPTKNRKRNNSPNMVEMENLEEDSKEKWGECFYNIVYSCIPYLFYILIALLSFVQ